MQGDGEPERHGSLSAYLRCLREHREFRLLWIAETTDNVGAWLNYVATMVLVQEFSGGSGLALSGVVLIRFLPSLLLAPLTGVLADRLNRIRILIVMALAGGLAAAALALVHDSSQLGLLYVLLFLQFCATSFYDPARKAMLPVVVPEQDLHLATTIDSFAWSLTGAVGASLGGVVASRVGYSACFLIDAATYCFAAWCAALVPQALGEPGAMTTAGSKRLAKSRSTLVSRDSQGSLELVEAPLPEALPPAGEEGTAPRRHGAQGLVHHSRRRSTEVEEGGEAGGSSSNQQQQNSSRRGSPDRPPSRYSGYHKESDAAEVDVEQDGIALAPPAGGGTEGAHHAQQAGSSGYSTGLAGAVAAAGAAWKEGVRAFWEGWTYLLSRDNKDVAVIVTIKGSAALCWGAVDIANVRFAEMPSMQWLGDTESTLGYIFGMVGFGCFIGPIVLNVFIKPQPTPLLWGVVAAFCLLLAGYAAMLVAPNILLVLLSTFIRSMGSATLWIYSTLLLQLRVPNDILGRMSAVEMALYTVAEAASSTFTGAALDWLGLGLFGLCLVLTIIQTVITAGWVAYALASNWPAGGGGKGHRRSGPGYQAVPTS